MRGLIKVTGKKGRKIIHSTVYGNTDAKATLKARLMNRHKIKLNERVDWSLIGIEMTKNMEEFLNKLDLVADGITRNNRVKFRNYQVDIINRGSEILSKKGFVYLAMEVRTGKTYCALGISERLDAKKVLFLTKKKAISSIQENYDSLDPPYDFELINYESVHKANTSNLDVLVLDEAHSMGAFPKPSKRAKQVKEILAKNQGVKVILLSGTPTPESYSQIYHQVYGIKGNPFSEFKNFYRFCDYYVNVTEKKMGGLTIKDYSDGLKGKILSAIAPFKISYTQKEAGFVTSIKEHKLYVDMLPSTYKIINRLKRDFVVEGKDEVILADTKVKLMMKVHQLCSGTVKFESGNSTIIDHSKAEFIFDNFGLSKIGIFYKFTEELSALKSIYGDQLTTDLEEFNSTSKSIALQIVAGREGVSLKLAEVLVYYNIDFSATSYWQSRDRMTTKDRKYSDVYWIFSKGGIEDKIYSAVSGKKSYTVNHFKRDM